jgi:FG-GAP-like repeat
MNWRRHLPALILPALLAGCDRAPETPATPAPPAISSTALPAKATATAADDPAQDGWDTEAANDKVGAQLAVLKAWLISKSPAPGDLAQLMERDCRVLAPAAGAPKLVFSDGVVLVNEKDAVPAQPELRGALEQELKKLRQGTDAHAAIKVTGIQKSAAGWTTKLRVQLDERTSTRRRQLNADWMAEWTNEFKLAMLDFAAWTEVSMARGFADCTETLFAANESWKQQLAFGTDHWTARIESVLGMDVNGQTGVTLGDINGDGLDDVYLVQQGGLPNLMFLRQADGSLRDVTKESGTGWLDDGHAALLVDLDNDGDQDLALGTRDGVLIHANDGTGKFTVKAAKLTPTAVPFGLSAADYDQDGDLDIFASGYYQRTTVARSEVFARPVPYYDATNGAQDILLRNDGNWRFTDAAKASGMVESKFGYAPSWEDYDNDGDLDLYVANDFGANLLWRNERSPEGVVVFKEVAAAAGVQDIAAGMSSAWGDPDNDGRMDLYVANMFSSAGNRIAFQEKFQRTASEDERQLFQRHARGNSLFRNKGGGVFDDVSETAGVTLGRWAWSSRFGDLNNDGFEDIYVANGYITQEDPHDL